MRLFGFVILKQSSYEQLLEASSKLSIENVRLRKKIERIEPKRDKNGKFTKK